MIMEKVLLYSLLSSLSFFTSEYSYTHRNANTPGTPQANPDLSQESVLIFMRNKRYKLKIEIQALYFATFCEHILYSRLKKSNRK